MFLWISPTLLLLGLLAPVCLLGQQLRVLERYPETADSHRVMVQTLEVLVPLGAEFDPRWVEERLAQPATGLRLLLFYAEAHKAPRLSDWLQDLDPQKPEKAELLKLTQLLDPACRALYVGLGRRGSLLLDPASRITEFESWLNALMP